MPITIDTIVYDIMGALQTLNAGRRIHESWRVR